MEANRKRILTYVVVGVVVLSVVLALSDLNRAPRGGQAARFAPASREDVIGLIYLEGPFQSGHSSAGVFGSATGGDNILAFLRQAQMDPAVKAVVIRMNCPGGTVAASEEIAAEIKKLRAAGKKVVTSMADVAASGAYWIAANTDRIWASPGTMTGSIGAIMEITRVEELYKKIGVEPDVIKSAPLKDIGSSSRQLTAEERKILQAMVDEMHEAFVQNIAQGRKMNVDDVRKIADGRVLTGTQAKKLGLVDELGNFYDAVNDAAKLAGLRRWQMKEYGRVTPLERLMSLYTGDAGSRTGLPASGNGGGSGATGLTGNPLLDMVWILKDLVNMPGDVPTK